MMRKQLLLVSHCLLNPHSKVDGPEAAESPIGPFLTKILQAGVGIIQLPCPELALYGKRRWGHVYDQFDNPFFREHCRRIFQPFIPQIEEYLANGYEFLGVLGVEGSPSCGVAKTCRGKWGGELASDSNRSALLDTLEISSASGVFIEEIRKTLESQGISVKCYGCDESCPEELAVILQDWQI